MIASSTPTDTGERAFLSLVANVDSDSLPIGSESFTETESPDLAGYGNVAGHHLVPDRSSGQRRSTKVPVTWHPET